MPSSIRILTGADIDHILSALSPEKAIASQASVFGRFSQRQGGGDIQSPHRLTISAEGSTMLFMPSRAPTLAGPQSRPQSTTSIKIVAVPTNASGLPATTLVMDESTGKVKAVLNARKLTALRNAAGSALFLSLFPPRPPKHMVIFGSGAQAYFHALLILRLYPSIARLTLVVRSSTARSEELVSSLSARFGHVTIASSVHTSSASDGLDQLVSSADIILTATSSTVPLFKSSPTTPKDGARVLMVGSYKPTMHEVDTDLMRRAKVVVDSRDMCALEAGEIIDAGLGAEDLTEIGEVVNDQKDSGLGNGKITQEVLDRAGGEDGVILFKSVGLGIQDVAISRLVLDEAEALGLGTIVDDYDV